MFARPRNRIIALIVALALLTGLGFGISQIITQNQIAQAQTQANGTAVIGVNTIAITNYAFSPAHVQVKVGTTITWINNDDADHTVTFSNIAVDSGVMPHGKVFQYTFTTPGDFTYRCIFHSAMIAKVTVVP